MTVKIDWDNARIRVELGITIEKRGAYIKGMVALEVDIPEDEDIDIDVFGQEVTDQVLSVLEDSMLETYEASRELELR